ncbi:hypothetical protein NPX79_00070 [Spiroplasma endosymbiont of Anurida maritima]|uniref:hypothetical protein n=1 Tax=Spiroplasma endosymbiont of Anurida maritima TaxID=2967972 RepID=UPI0036D2CBCA
MKNFKFRRGFIAVMAIFGLIVGLFMIGGYLDALIKYTDSIEAQDPMAAFFEQIIIRSYDELGGWKVTVLLFVVFTFSASIICNFGMAKYAITSSDEELINNKWVLAVLSLSIGSIWTAFLITGLPNQSSKSTKNPRVLIVRYLGGSWMAGAIMSLAFIAIVMAMLPEASKQFTSASSEQNFTIVMAVLGVISAISLMFVGPFYSKNIINHLKAKGFIGGYLRFISTVYAVIASFLMILQVISAFLQIFGGRNEGSNGGIFALMYLIARFAYFMMMMFIVGQILKGIWSKEDDYEINIPVYESTLSQNQHA